MYGFTKSSKCPKKGFKNRVNLEISCKNQIAAEAATIRSATAAEADAI